MTLARWLILGTLLNIALTYAVNVSVWSVRSWALSFVAGMIAYGVVKETNRPKKAGGKKGNSHELGHNDGM